MVSWFGVDSFRKSQTQQANSPKTFWSNKIKNLIRTHTTNADKHRSDVQMNETERHGARSEEFFISRFAYVKW